MNEEYKGKQPNALETVPSIYALNEAIQEYLVQCGFTKTVSAFQEELSTNQRAPIFNANQPNSSVISTLLNVMFYFNLL